MIQKYFFKKQLKQNLSIPLESFWWNIWSEQPNSIRNLKLELNNSPSKIHRRDKNRIGLKTFMVNDGAQLDMLQSVFKILALDNSLSTKVVINSSDIEQLINNQDWENLEVSNKKQSLGLVNSALNKWNGGKLIRIKDSRKQVKNDGKKNDYYKYNLINKFEDEIQKEFSKTTIKDIFQWISF